MQLTNIGTIKELMNKYGFSFRKSLGQNFLINPSVCPRIAELGLVSDECGVIEIGVGFGVLTRELSKNAKKVVAIEIDQKLMPVLDETLADLDNVTLINQDVLKVDLEQLIEQEFSGMDVCVCANLPYYITSPILMMLLEKRLPIKSITVLVQKETAVRLCAEMGTRDCGAVTAAVRFYSDPKILFDVSSGSFMPAPKVDSSVIRLDIIQDKYSDVDDEQFLFDVIRTSFTQRRKVIVNPLSPKFNVSKQQIKDILVELDIDVNSRPEQLTMEQFILLANGLKKIVH